MTNPRVSKTLKRAAVVGLAILAFTWGYRVHSKQVFPYWYLRWADARLFGLSSMNRIVIEAPAAKSDVLDSLPYVRSAPDPHGIDAGVLIHDASQAFDGFTLYSPRTVTKAFLIRMDGEEVWEWRDPEEPEGWQHVEMLPDAGLLALVKDKYVKRMDGDSNLIWKYETRAHHDFWLRGDEVWLLTREGGIIPAIHKTAPTLSDKIAILKLEDGTLLREIDLLDLLMKSPYRYLLPRINDRNFFKGPGLDVLHTNHVEVFDGSRVDRSNLFRDGNVLVSMRNINAIFIFDPAAGEIEWLWGPSNVSWQHHPSLTAEGTITLFDNGVKQSQVIEIAPHDYEVVWRYTKKGFFSELRGGAQRLPNGNTLITESDTGHIFEVTPKGERVWEFATPYVDDDGNRSTIWRGTRFTRDAIPFL